MKVKVHKVKRTLTTHEGMVGPNNLFMDSNGFVAIVTRVAKHSVSGRKLVIINKDGEEIAVPMSLFNVEYTKILDEGEVPF